MNTKRAVTNAQRKKKSRVSRSTRRNGVRSGVRRESASPARRQQEEQLRQLNIDAATTIGFDRAAAEKLPPPTLAFHFGLVEHGYEIHMFDEGKYVGAVCRDFSDNHKVDDLKESLVDAIEKAFKGWRTGL